MRTGRGVKRKRPASGDGEGRSKEPKRQKKDAGMYSITDARYEELDSSAEAATIVQWRYDIQVALFPHGNRKPSSSLMSQVADTFALLDSFEGMTIEYLAYSKLLPLMKRITTADPDRIPRDSFFRFRERAAAFVEKWEEMLDGMTLED
ncbi:hypothetical protein C8F01DRAFT_668111 [Mycena amicta]|nr:hypothetical protein C8F01DRAFT_668111 [Mycena amicta]